MLTQDGAVSYLLKRELLSPAHVVEGDVVVEDISRRHHSYRITASQGPGYVLKQGVGQDRMLAVEREAAVYKLLGSGMPALSRYVPRLHAYDAREHVLVLELVDDSLNLREYHLRRGRFPTTLARLLGQALGALHRWTGNGAGEEQDVRLAADPPPWVFSLHRPRVDFLRECSSANLQVIQLIQRFPPFGDLLDGLSRQWRTEALVHRDIRWDNWIVARKQGPSDRSRLRLVDWELASAGDPCWDAGSVLADYLGFWLLSIPVTGELPPDRFLELARYPLEKMQPALRAFWEAYVREMGLGAATADEWLLRSTRYAAARLVQTAFEQMQMSVQLTGNVVCLLQLSLNMLQRPLEATLQLLGVPLRRLRLP